MIDDRASWLPEGDREGVSRFRRVDWLLEGVPKDFTDHVRGGIERDEDMNVRAAARDVDDISAD